MSFVKLIMNNHFHYVVIASCRHQWSLFSE